MIDLVSTNPTEIADIEARQKAISAFDHVPVSQIPADAVTASGSGLDPDITPANAYMQVDRIAAARNLPVAEVRNLVTQNITGRTLGFLGEPTVNVLALNILLDELSAAWYRLQLARRFHNDAVALTRSARRAPLVRLLRLAGSAPEPVTFELDDEWPEGLRHVLPRG